MQKAIVCVVAASFILVCLDTCAKAMSERYDPLLVVWWRYVIAAGLSVLIFAPTLRRGLRTMVGGQTIELVSAAENVNGARVNWLSVWPASTGYCVLMLDGGDIAAFKGEASHQERDFFVPAGSNLELYASTSTSWVFCNVEVL